MALREKLEEQGNWLFRWRSYLPLLFIPLLLIALRNGEFVEKVFGDDIGDWWESAAIFISLLGLVIRAFRVGYVPRGTSGRNTRSQAAAVLNTTGMYSVTRNPLYLGNFIIILGVVLFIQVWWLALITWIGFWLYYERSDIFYPVDIKEKNPHFRGHGQINFVRGALWRILTET